MKFKDRSVIVTGSADNIGRAIALAFAREGARVIVNARTNETGCRAVVDAIRTEGGEADLFVGDVSSEEVAKDLTEFCVRRFGTIDILVNNAGSASKGNFLELDRGHWELVLQSNLLSAVMCSRSAAQIMLSARQGCIINTTSIRGLEHCGRAGVMAYSASKAALTNFTKQLAIELSPHINVNGVAPGYTATSAFDDMPEDQKSSIAGRTLIKRWITCEELAQTYLFIASMPAMTGEIIVVDGGYNLKEIPG